MALARLYTPKAVPDAVPAPRLPETADAKREDGRVAREMHPVVLRTRINTEGGGSAFLELGATKVVCLINGPKSVARGADVISDMGVLSCDLRFAPFARKERKTMAQNEEDRALTAALTNALTPAVMLGRYPKSSIEVVALVLEDDGAALAAAITCASVALLDAGIEMRDVVAACTLVAVGTAAAVMDPTAGEQAAAAAAGSPARVVTAACMPALGQVTHLELAGEGSAEETAAAVATCVAACAARADDVKGALRAVVAASAQQRRDGDAAERRGAEQTPGP